MTLSGRILGIDYGSRRIGVALSDPLHIIGKGLKIIPNSPRAADEIARICSEYGVTLVVVGMPFTLKGEIGQKGVEIREFIQNLGQKITVGIVEWDERFTSRTAQETLRTMGVKKSRRQSKGAVDAMAAALILQGYLDAHRQAVSQTRT